MSHNGYVPAGFKAARGLGWTSIAVGLTEIFATGRLMQMMGVAGREFGGVLRVLGVREIMHGVDILSHEDPTPGIWARLAGDALDSVVLGLTATRTRNPAGLAKVAKAVMPIVALDVLLAGRLSRQKRGMSQMSVA